MPNKFKFGSDSTDSNSLFKGNWMINLTDPNTGGGPSGDSHTHVGHKVPPGGYVIYAPDVYNNSRGITAYAAKDDADLIGRIVGIQALGNFPDPVDGVVITSKIDALNWANTQDSIFIVEDKGMPNIVTDGLVQYFDANNVASYFNNIPTTNQYINPEFDNNASSWTFGSWDGNISRTTETVVGPFGKEITVLKLTKNNASSYSHFHQYNGGKYTTGNQYTQSAWVKGFGTFQGKSHWGGNVSWTLTGVWQYVTFTVTATTDINGNFPYWAAESLTTGNDFYMAYPQTEIGPVATPFTSGTRSQHTIASNLGNFQPQPYTIYAQTYPENNYEPSARDGITPGYNEITADKLYDAGRGLSYFVFNENTNEWLDDSYFNGRNGGGHHYDVYGYNETENEQFVQDFNNLHALSDNLTHIVIASHAAENFATHQPTIDALTSIGLAGNLALGARLEFIVAGKVNKPHTHNFAMENINSAVALMNIVLPLEEQHVELQNGVAHNGNAFEFDGVNNRIMTSLNTAFNDFTVTIAFKDNGSGAWGRLVDKYYGNGFFISSYFATYGQGYVGAGIIEPSPPHGHALQFDLDRWHFFTSVREGTSHRIYLDGVQQTSTRTVSGNALNQSEIAFGAWWDQLNSQQFTGEIANATIYNRALTTDEILQNYYQGNIVTSGLIRALDFSNPVCYEKNDTTGLDLTNTDGFDLLNSPTPINTHGGGILFGEDNEFLVMEETTSTDYATIECWYTRRGGTSGEDIVFNQEDVWELKDNGGSIQWALQVTNHGGWFWVNTGATIEVGETAHIALSYDGNSVKFYKNGILVQTYGYPAGGTLRKEGTFPKLNSRHRDRTSIQNPGNHDFYQFRIYDRALLDSEVLQNFEAHMNKFGL